MPIFLAILLVLVSAVLHYETLWRLNLYLPCLHIFPKRATVLLAVMGAMVSHLLQITCFAAIYFLMARVAGPDLTSGSSQLGFGDFLYFSMETYTSLGYGEIFPLRELRLLVGIESITGLLMIAWTASFTFLEMQRYWGDSGKRHKH